MRDCTIRKAKTKALISYAVTAQLISVFVFAYAKIRFSHNEAHMNLWRTGNYLKYPLYFTSSYQTLVYLSLIVRKPVFGVSDHV